MRHADSNIKYFTMKKCYGCQIQLPLEAFGSDKSKASGKSTYCLKCRADKQKVKRTKRPYVDRNYRLRRNYKVTREWYENKLKEQNNRCEICKSDIWDKKKNIPQVDHNHTTGEVRGLLCNGCNSMLGFGKDNPSILAAGVIYLLKYGGAS